MDDLNRFLALERHLVDRLSTRTQPFDHGVAFFDDDYPQRYASNFLLAEEALGELTPEALLDDADRILGDAGFEHRTVVVRDDVAGRRFAPTFAAHGYAVDRNAIMVHRREPDRGPGLDVEELRFADIRSLFQEVYRRRPWTGEETALTFAEQHGKNERAIGARFFAARLEGELAGKCELYVDGLDAQVEHVDTLEEFRGRGVARAVVLAAVDEARQAGARHIFIVADEADWPKELYARLGFDIIGRTWEFMRGKGVEPGGGNPEDRAGPGSYSTPPTHRDRPTHGWEGERMDEAQDPGWEDGLIDEAIREAERRRAEERDKARRRAVQMAREQAYHRLAMAIDRPARRVSPDQLKLFPTDPPTLFDEGS